MSDYDPSHDITEDPQSPAQKRVAAEIEDKFDRISISSPTPKKSRTEGMMPDHSCVGPHIPIARNHRDEERCSGCNELAVAPHTVIECGHTYGKAALDILTKDGTREFQCVGHDLDGDGIEQCQSIVRISDLRLNKAVDRGIKKKMVHCPNRKKGCQATMQLKEEEAHLNTECQYQDEKCRSCNKMFARSNLANHESTCTAKRCAFSAVGCNDVSAAGEMGQSGGAMANIGVHLSLLYQFLASFKSIAEFKPREYNAALTEQTRESEGHGQVTRLLNEPDRVKEEEMAMGEIKKQMESLKQDASSHTNTLSRLMHEDFAIDVAAAWQRQRHRQEFLLLHEEITNEAMGKHMELIQQVPTLISHGSVIFKVSNFTEKRTSAIQGILKKGIYGPPFFTHEYGYKMVPILYPNGDGAGAGTHLSIFLAVMKGEYDALQRWPLTGKITMSILSQKRVGREAVKHCFRTDVASLSYHRPSGEINQASGIPRALDLALLRQPSDYLVDDTLFIQVIVEPQLPSSSMN